METHQCESSSSMVKAHALLPSRPSAKLNQITPLDLLEKQLDVQTGTAHVKNAAQQIKVVSDSVFLPQKDKKETLSTVIRVKPVYWLGSFLQTIDLIGDGSSSFSVKKVRSFPQSKYELTDHTKENATFELSSNFVGSKYQLTKDGITHLTMTFEVGCGARCRGFNIFTLRDKAKWDSLAGTQDSKDLEVLYPISNNYQSIAKYTNLQPSICPRTGITYLKFSRRAVVPCVENTIICNLNGQKLMELMKINEDEEIFEVCMDGKWPVQKVFAVLVASFDFKVGLE